MRLALDKKLNEDKANDKLPAWVNERMLQEGKNPNRTFNDVDLSNKSVIDAINSDPTLTSDEKANLLSRGSRRHR